MAKAQPKVTPMAMAIAILVFRTDSEVFRCISLRPDIFCLIWFDGSVFLFRLLQIGKDFWGWKSGEIEKD